MKPIRLILSLSGRPAAACRVRIAGAEAEGVSDASGIVELAIPTGKLDGVAIIGANEHPFTVVNAPGTRLLRVELREIEQPIDDPRVRDAYLGGTGG